MRLENKSIISLHIEKIVEEKIKEACREIGAKYFEYDEMKYKFEAKDHIVYVNLKIDVQKPT